MSKKRQSLKEQKPLQSVHDAWKSGEKSFREIVDHFMLYLALSVVSGFWGCFHFLSSQRSFHLHRTFESLFMLLELKKLFG